MTLALVRNELNRFLRSPDAEVLALRGKWGVGKTYSWRLDERPGSWLARHRL